MSVIEIDGPPQAYFEMNVMDPDTGREHMGRFVYRTLRCVGETEEAVREWMADALIDIKAACELSDAFIIWRCRPSFSEEYEYNLSPKHRNRKVWKGYCRLITSRPIPEEVWSKYQVAQDAEPHRVWTKTKL